MPDPIAATTVGTVQTEALTTGRDNSYVDWGCALAGAVLAAAISFVLFTFGAGIGLSMISAFPGASSSGTTVLVTTTVWTILVNIIAFAAGGYVAGRMRRPWAGAQSEEVEFRDGAHGALVWAIGIVLGAFILASASAGALRAGAQGVGSAVSTVAQSQSNAPGQGTDWTSVAVDSLFRNTNQPPAPNANANPQDARAEAGRIVARSVANGEISAADKTYLSKLVAARTGIPEAEAQARVDQTINDARAAADKARKTGVIAAFLAAATLMIAAAVAWTSAVVGGQHRQTGTIWRGFAGSTEIP